MLSSHSLHGSAGPACLAGLSAGRRLARAVFSSEGPLDKDPLQLSAELMATRQNARQTRVLPVSPWHREDLPQRSFWALTAEKA